MSTPTLTLDTVVRVASSQISTDVAGEVAIMDVARGVYYGLDEIGALVWRGLRLGADVRSLRDEILAAYEVDAATCERDLMVLLSELVERGLVEVDGRDDR